MNFRLLNNGYHQNTITNFLAIAAICLIGIVIYSNTLDSPFHFDDQRSIVENYSLREPFNLKDIWNFDQVRSIAYFTLAINYHFSQLQVRGYHLINIFIHLVSAILVWWFIHLTFLSPYIRCKDIFKHRELIAFFSGLLFVTHPIQTQAVTYIIQRCTSLASLFFLLSLTLYIKARLIMIEKSRAQSWIVFYGFSLLFGILGIFTKEIVITLPFMILLYEVFFLRDRERKIGWAYLAPFIFILLILPAILLWTKDIGLKEFGLLAEETSSISRRSYLFTQCRVLITYLRLVLLPVKQNLDYNYPVLTTLWSRQVLISLSLLVTILIIGIRFFAAGYRLISFAIFWFFINLSLESSVIPIKDLIFEHRLYLPMAGYSFFLPVIVCHVLKRGGIRITVLSLFLIAGFYSILTFQRNSVWNNGFELWNDTVNKSPGKARPYNNRGLSYLNRGKYDKAIFDFNRALKIESAYVGAYYNRGIAYAKKGEYNRALEDFNTAIIANSKHMEAFYNKGTAYKETGQHRRAIIEFNKAAKINLSCVKIYNNRGLTYLEKGDYDKSLSDFNQVIEIKPFSAMGYFNRGIFYSTRGYFRRAIADLDQSLKIEPGNSNAYNRRGIALTGCGEFERAIHDFTLVIEIDPENPEAFKNRGIAYINRGKFNLAIDDFNRALERDPDSAEIFNNRGTAYASRGEFNRAIEDYSQSLEITPDYIDAYINRGTAYANLEKYSQAISDFSRILVIQPTSIRAYNNRGAVYATLGNYEKSIADFQSALSINPEYKEATKNLERALLSKIIREEEKIMDK